ncbi:MULTISPECIES: hypothetical protein [Bacillus]|uniref:hypothetical protein n=1 Tax=Bacillus TaxID=1386 RepID=UPI0002E2B9AF|nr:MULTISPECIES: hypothetical protein [Bacillus]MCY7774924.1 hypothetical protein [Bacillus licheniformis]MCY8540099.1 hypothetical protein [Bacillus haynesii]MCY9286472.1 hypothetical protein [Bacillus licheniformis]MED0688662.1 hypothetical protein [Bacillus licheniformis]MED0713078.1 hypothetical protein [Bacillus licheniformis]
MKDYQKLETPQLIELAGEYEFIIATKIDISEIRSGIIFMKGQSCNYENGEILEGNIKEVSYSVMQNEYFDLDEKGKVID